MLAIRLEATIEKRLQRLAKRTGRTKASHVREAVLEHLDDSEDVYLAVQRLKTARKSYSAEEVKRRVPQVRTGPARR